MRNMYQVSTLSALALGYTRPVITVSELLEHGNIGLGTYENVDGEMIMIDGSCFRAMEDGTVVEAEADKGVPFASVTKQEDAVSFETGPVANIEKLKEMLTVKVEEDFALNSMHVVRIDGSFDRICARSESPYRSHHVDLKDILAETQKDFIFDDIYGSLVCVYYPDFMDGINLPGWHIHFISQDGTAGGHVFDLKASDAHARWSRINSIEIRVPTDPAFDTYALKSASQGDIKEVEQGDK